MKLWTVREARAQFAALLDAARKGDPQIVRQSGLPDVQVTVDRNQLPMSHLTNALARCDAMELALEQHRHQQEGTTNKLVDMHLPPNLSGDVLAWVLHVQGAFEAASYIISAVDSMRDLQETLHLPLSTADQIVTGLRVTAGTSRVITAESAHWIERLAAKRWGNQAPVILGANWSDAVDKALQHH